MFSFRRDEPKQQPVIKQELKQTKEQTMQTRIYKVEENVTDGQPKRIRLVEATSQSQAVRHVTGELFKAEVVKSKDLATLMKNGVAVEQAAADAQ